MKVTLADIQRIAPDKKALDAARKIADPRHWPALGRDKNAVWGECAGSATYAVYIDEALNCDCNCPSRKRPCKHALALLMLEAGGHPMPEKPASASHREAAMEGRYESSWE